MLLSACRLDGSLESIAQIQNYYYVYKFDDGSERFGVATVLIVLASESRNMMVHTNQHAESANLYETPFGDVKLKCHGHRPDKLGTVTVFYPGYGYVPVCLDGFNRAAAAAVCRQLGYVDALQTFRNGDFKNLSFQEQYNHITALKNIIIQQLASKNLPNNEHVWSDTVEILCVITTVILKVVHVLFGMIICMIIIHYYGYKSNFYFGRCQ